MKALSIVVILILSAQFAVAQVKGEKEIPVPLKDSTIFYEGVLKTNPDLEQMRFYQHLRHWASTKLLVPPASFAILYENPQEGVLSARLTLNTIEYSFLSSEYYMRVQGIIYFQVKQGKVRYTITDFIYNLEEDSKTEKFFSEGDSKKLIFRATADELLKTKRKEYMYYLSEIEKRVQIQLKSLEQFLNKPIIADF